MSNAKAQEYRVKRYFENHPDIKLLKYYGSREKNCGDFLIRMGGKQYRVDNKSTTNQLKLIVKRGWHPKLCAICLDRMDKEGVSVPLHTLTALSHRTVWVMYGRRLFMDAQFTPFRIKPGKKQLTIKTGELYDIGKEARIDMDGFTVYICKLEDYVKEVLR